MTELTDDLPEDPDELDDADVPDVDDDGCPIEPDEVSGNIAHPTDTDDPDALPRMNVETLQKAMPGLDHATAEAYLPLMEQAMNEFGINNPARAQMWLAQVGHESGSLRYMQEIASGAAYEGRADLGNTQPGDGRRFKGRDRFSSPAARTTPPQAKR